MRRPAPRLPGARSLARSRTPTGSGRRSSRISGWSSRALAHLVRRLRGPAWATWFVGAKLNMRPTASTAGRASCPSQDRGGLRGEDGAQRGLTFAEQSQQVTKLAEALVGLGVEPGDRVAIYLPMSPEAAVASHACAHIGAVQVPDLLGLRRARRSPSAYRTRRRRSRSPWRRSSRRGRRGADAGRRSRRRTVRRRATGARCARTIRRAARRLPGTLEPLAVDSEHPYLLTYTSGTTGKPKGVLHVQGGFLISIAREVGYQADARPGEVIHFATDMGWIMGPWTVVGGGALGATIVYAEGAPDSPSDRLWSLVEEERVTILGLLADADPRARAARRPDAGPLVAADRRHDGRTVEPRPLPLAVRKGRAAAAARSSTARAGPRSARASSLQRRPARSRSARSAGQHSGWRWTSSTTTDGRSSATGAVGELVCRRPFPGHDTRLLA